MPRTNDPRDIVEDSPMAKQDGYGASTFEPESVGQQAKRVGTNVGEKVQDQADAGLDTAADGLSNAADKIRERTASTDGIPAQAGMKVADTIESTAGYLREHDTTEIVDDLEKYVREHPMQALAGAIVGGFIIGRILK